MTNASVQVRSGARKALITGASLGIGLEMARLFAADKTDLVLVARSTDKLEALASELARQYGISASVYGADLAEAGAAKKLFARVKADGHVIDDLVNNAGFGQYGAFLDLDPEEELRMLQLNIVALTELTRLFAGDMATRSSGRILNVASTAAFQPGPLMAAYYASKAYVLSFSEALANELADHGITVTALCPGPTRSGFQAKAQLEGSRILSMGLMDSVVVARQGYRAFKSGKPVVITGLLNNLFAQSVRVTPRCLVTKMSRLVANQKEA